VQYLQSLTKNSSFPVKISVGVEAVINHLSEVVTALGVQLVLHQNH